MERGREVHEKRGERKCRKGLNPVSIHTRDLPENEDNFYMLGNRYNIARKPVMGFGEDLNLQSTECLG